MVVRAIPLREICWLDEVISCTLVQHVGLMVVPNRFASSQTSRDEVPVATGAILDQPPGRYTHICPSTWRLRFKEKPPGGNLKMAKRMCTYRSVPSL